jgi:hypothetical protein
MARSRHGRTGGGSSPADSGLPSWARRHLEEAGEPGVDTAALAARTRHRRAAEASGLRGWGVAIVSVAAAVGAVPLAISSLANDHSADPLPRVDTYTAGSPGPLQGGPAPGGASRAGRPGTAPGGDAATGGVLDAPPAAPEARSPGVSGPAFAAAPVPAAVVRPTPRVLPPTVTPAKTTAPTTTTEGRSATKPPKSSPSKPPKSNPKPSGGGGSNGGGSNGGGGASGGGSGNGGGGGVLGNVLDTGAKTVGGVTDTVGGLLR